MELSQEGQLPHKGASAPPAPPDPCHCSVTEGCEPPPSLWVKHGHCKQFSDTHSFFLCFFLTLRCR